MLLLRQEFPDKAKRKVIVEQFNQFFLNNLTLQKRLEHRCSTLLSKTKRQKAFCVSLYASKWLNGKNLEAN